MIETLSKKQARILKFIAQDDKKYLICDGAVRTGKTVVMTIAFIIWAMETFDGCNFAICSKTVASAERNILKPLLSSGELPYVMQYRRADRLLTCSMGTTSNTFYCFGGKDESSYELIQGITLAGVLLDEVALMPKSFVDQAMARTLTFSNAKIWFNCNPESYLHWFNQEWIIPADDGKRDNVVHLHFLMEDNPILTPDAIMDTSSMFTGAFYRRYILGEWCAAEGLVYDMFDANIHVLDDAVTEGDYYVSADYGVQNATVFLLWRKEKGTNRWIIIDEYYYSGRDNKKQKSNDELAEDLIAMLNGRDPKVCIVDPSAAGLIVELRKRHIHCIKADNDVIDGIQEVSVMLRQERLAVLRRCRHTIEEFGIYAWDPKAADRGEDRPVKTADHCMDAMRYMAHTKNLVKIKQEYTSIWG